MRAYPKPPFPAPDQQPPGRTAQMDPLPDHGEDSYEGHGRLKGKIALITGGDSGIGRAVAIAYAREGVDIAIAYLSETEDARDTAGWIERAGRDCLLLPGDLGKEAHCKAVIDKVVAEFGRIDILVNNAAYQMSYDSIDEISGAEWRRTFAVNLDSMFHLVKAALPHMKKGAAIINTSSINADKPNPSLLPYATSKGAIRNFTAGLAQLLAEKGIRVNCVAPGPVWTPLIPSTLPSEDVRQFGADYPMKRPAQPAELAPAFVLLAEDAASYISGTTIAVTGGMPFL